MKKRKTHKLYADCIPDRCSRLEVGECFLVKQGGEQNSAYATNSIRAAKRDGRLDGDYIVRRCIGHTVDLKTPPFSFYQITRVS